MWLISTLVSLVIRKEIVYMYVTERERHRNYFTDNLRSF